MKICENQPEISEFLAASGVNAITGFSQCVDSIACRESIASVINPELLRHAPTGTGCGYAIPSTDTRFMSSTIHAHGFIQSQQWMNAGFQISDSAYHTASLFDVRPFATQTSSTSISMSRKLRISNQTLHTNGSPGGLFKSAAIASPAQSRMLLPQPPRLRLAPLYCHLPLPESRG